VGAEFVDFHATHILGFVHFVGPLVKCLFAIVILNFGSFALTAVYGPMSDFAILTES
jgi:hypothetical protein